jgi:hypothetical protein
LFFKGNSKMPRGGSRPGAGRKQGGYNTKSREIAERVIGEGSTPLEVMIRNMRFYDEEAIRLVNELTARGAPEPEEGEAGEVNASLVEQLRTILTLRKMAGEEAARAAPYVHPRVGYDSGDASGDPDFIPLAERLAYYQREDELKEAGENVIPLKPAGDQAPSDYPH